MPALKCATLCLSLALAAAARSEAADGGAGMPTPASRYFGGNHTSVAYQPRHRPAVKPQPMETGIGGKPFQGMNREPTVSPYLALDLLNDDDTALPNYYAFYQPMRQQQEANQAQAAQVHRLQQQVRVANATGAVSRNPLGGMPTTGTSSQFMNLGGYFPDLR